jgi:hypothetical protein
MRLALRSLAKSPGFALAVVLTLALGIGANTAVFSVLRGVMLRPLPHRDGDRLLYLRQSTANTGQQDIWFSVPEIEDIRSGAPSLAAVAEFSSLTFNLIGAGEPVQIQAGIVTGNFFEVMGLGAVLGCWESPRFEPLIGILSHLARLNDLGLQHRVAILPQLDEASGVRSRLPALATPPIQLAQPSIDAGELDGQGPPV